MIFYSIDVRHSRQSDYSVRVNFPEGGKIALLPQETIIAKIRHRELLLPLYLFTRVAPVPAQQGKAISPQFRHRELLLRSDLINPNLDTNLTQSPLQCIGGGVGEESIIASDFLKKVSYGNQNN
jgi:hypothetical protein